MLDANRAHVPVRNVLQAPMSTRLVELNHRCAVYKVGWLAGRDDPAARDTASAAAAALCVAAGANIVRMHDVPAGVDAVRVADAIVAAAPGFGGGLAPSAPAGAGRAQQGQEGSAVKGVQTATITTVVTALSGVAGAVM